MASSSVYNLTRFTALAAGDVIPAVDVSDATQNVHGSLDSITITNFFGTIPVPVVITSVSATAFVVGPHGTTNPTLTVDASGTSAATGLSITSKAAGGLGIVLGVTSTATDENLLFLSKGAGAILFNNLRLEQKASSASSVGMGSGALIVRTGTGNTGIGASTLGSTTSGTSNTAVGSNAGFNVVTGARNVFLGFNAGKYETGSDAFYIDNQDRTNTAGDKSGALLYGTFSATATSQTLTINASVTLLSGTTLTVTGTTITGTPTWSSNQAITLSTASQPNITSVGTLTSLVLSGGISGITTLAGTGAVSGFTSIDLGTHDRPYANNATDGTQWVWGGAASNFSITQAGVSQWLTIAKTTGNVTIPGGTTAVQALTVATTAVITGATTLTGGATANAMISVAAVGKALAIAPATGTLVSYAAMTNTGATLSLGIEGVAGGALATGTASYATYLGTDAATALSFGTNSVRRGGFSSTGAFDLTVIGAFVASDKYLVVDSSGNVHKSATGPAS